MKQINFTDEQNVVINLSSGEHLVLAPPGTGKTELLAERVVRALDRGVKHDDLICLTFTNRAAENMVNRIAEKIGENAIFIGNIHKWCSQFLYKKQIIPRSTSLLDEYDSSQLAQEILEILEIETESWPSKFVKFSASVKQINLGFSDEIVIREKINDVGFYDLYRFYLEYEKIKKDSLYIDFDDLLTLTYDFLKKNENFYCCSWLQVDEVQDLNPMQWAIIDLITNQDSHRVFFGDYEQAIFSFMGANVESLRKIENNGAKIHHLSKNFRSPDNLIQLYNTYAKIWLDPKWDSIPTSGKSNCSEIQSALDLRNIHGSRENEASWIVKYKLPKEPARPTAILVRTNHAADMYSKLFDEIKVEYFKVSGIDIFQKKEVKDLFSFFRTLINNEDRIAWSRILRMYGNVETLKESRRLINRMFEIGMRPTDFIDLYPDNCCLLDYFYNLLTEKRVVVFDTETTGLDVEFDDVIQIAAVEIVNGQLCREFVVYINTEHDLASSEKIHNISKQFLYDNSICKKDALLKFKEFVGNDPLIAHNVQYDKEILFYNYKREKIDFFSLNIVFFDSIDIAKRLFPKLVVYKLSYLIKNFDIKGENTHNAIDDVRATVNLLLFFKNQIKLEAELRSEFIKHNNKLIMKFKKQYVPLYNAISSKFSHEMPLHEITVMVLGYMENIYKISDGVKLYERLGKIINFMEKKCNVGKVLNTLKKYVPEFSKYSEVDLLIGNEKLFIATIHKAKGLEFDNVIIPQVVNGMFPIKYAKSTNEINEEARILYVAMTRAKTNLLLTFSSKNIDEYDNLKNLSIFIKNQNILNFFSYKEVEFS